LTGALETRGGEDLSYLSGKGNGAPMRCQFSQCIIEEHYICGKTTHGSRYSYSKYQHERSQKEPLNH